MDESILREAGHRLYVTSRPKEMKRYLVFRARCRMHKDIIEDLRYVTLIKEQFDNKKELIMAYVDNESNVKIFDVFNRKVLNEG